jgi:nucleoside diphosphate kinase
MFSQGVRALGRLGRHRAALAAVGASALAASAFAANSSHCLSLDLDSKTAAALTKILSTALDASDESALKAATTQDILDELNKRIGTQVSKATNVAYVFAKPHANTPAVLEVIKSKFAEKGIKVLKEGVVTGEEIDKNGYIDQHYYAIAEKSTLTSGKDLPVNADKFKGTFGEDWATVVAEGRAFNALEFKKKFAAFSKEGALDKAWDATNVDKKTRVKLGGGFYCGQIAVDGVKYYTFNAFFMTMRGKFTAPGTSIHYYVVEFDPETLPWADFRGQVLGPTDPKDAPADSLRGIIAADWKGLGLKAPCNGGDNAVHASASPFEGLAERTNWLAGSIAEDPFGKALLEAGVSEQTIKKWSSDPQVKYDAATAKDTGKPKGSIFDALEDLDYQECLDRCVAISKA